jgi:hypothetical protein
VRLHGFGIPSGGALGGPWVVQSITNPYLTIDSPGVGAGVPRRFTVRGSYPPGDPGVRVRLLMGLDLHDVATARATYSPQGFAATLDAGSARGYAVVLVTNDSGVDGGPSAVSAIPVQLTDTPALPSSYVAVVNDRVAVIDSASGHVVRYLTDLQPGGGVSDAQLSPSGDVVYAQGAGTCASAIMSVPLRGGTPTVLVDAKGTSTLAQPALADDGSLAYLRTRCQGGATELVVRRPVGQLLTAATGVKLAGPLSWDPADSLFWVDSSDRTHLRSWSAHGDPSPHDPDAGPGCRWTALTVRGAKNDVLAARQCGAHVTFVAFDSDLAAPTPVFSFDGQPPIWLDADATGQQLIYVRYTGTEKTTVFARAEGQSPVRLATGQMYPTW